MNSFSRPGRGTPVHSFGIPNGVRCMTYEPAWLTPTNGTGTPGGSSSADFFSRVRHDGHYFAQGSGHPAPDLPGNRIRGGHSADRQPAELLVAVTGPRAVRPAAVFADAARARSGGTHASGDLSPPSVARSLQ